jgi:hypothetical protein
MERVSAHPDFDSSPDHDTDTADPADPAATAPANPLSPGPILRPRPRPHPQRNRLSPARPIRHDPHGQPERLAPGPSEEVSRGVHAPRGGAGGGDAAEGECGERRGWPERTEGGRRRQRWWRTRRRRRLEEEEEPGESEGPEGLRRWDAAETGDSADSASFYATAPPSTSCLLTRAVRHQEFKLPLHRMTQRFGRNPQRKSTDVTNVSRHLDSSHPRGAALPPRHEEHTHSSGSIPNQPIPFEHTATNRP